MLFDHKFVAMNRCWIFSSSVRDAMNVRCFWVHLVQTRAFDSLPGARVGARGAGMGFSSLLVPLKKDMPA